VNPRDVYAQSFNLADVTYWVTHEPAFGKQAVYLDDVDPGAGIPPLTTAELATIRAQGVRIFAPPIPALLAGRCEHQHARAVAVREGHQGRGPRHHHVELRARDLRRGAAFGGFYAAYDPEAAS
jgi:glycerophosphoryl diester phosphodiesterase